MVYTIYILLALYFVFGIVVRLRIISKPNATIVDVAKAKCNYDDAWIRADAFVSADAWQSADAIHFKK